MVNLMSSSRVLFFLVIVVNLSACEFWDVDTCLDRGGCWNYELKQCEFEKSDQCK